MNIYSFIKKFVNSTKRVSNTPSLVNSEKELWFEVDSLFNDFYDEGITVTGTPLGGTRRKERFYNLIQFQNQTLSINGSTIECGCWKGLSSFLLCNYLKAIDSSFIGENFYVVDSFSGLSEPSLEDALPKSTIHKLVTKHGKIAGAFDSNLEEVSASLSRFPMVSFYKGWIPDVLQQLPEQKYRFVHVDLDLYEPIIGSLNYFYPRMNQGGIIICDDYGSLAWPGAKKAVDEFCLSNKVSFISLSTGQALLWIK